MGEGATVGLLRRGNNNFNNYNNRRNVNANDNLDNRRGMTPIPWANVDSLKTYGTLYPGLCNYENLLLAFQKARVGKTQKDYIVSFEKNLQNELFKLQWELLTHTYAPRPLTTFTIRDPKTRKISASNFRDRVVHHAVCNIICPIFESRFIFDTFANRKGKGTLAALERFDHFMHKVTGNGRAVRRERERVIIPLPALR